MAIRLEGKAVAQRITEESRKTAEELRKNGIIPVLAIIRIGDEPGDISYEKGALKRAENTDIEVRRFHFSEDITQEELIRQIEEINQDDQIDGVLMLRPFPKHLDEKIICEKLDPAKDMDGITSGSMAAVFMDTDQGYPPCTAQACIEILDHYGVDLTGRKVTVVGRSLVIGKPVAMMAMKRNATVTMLHSWTSKDDFKDACSRADVVIAALGRAKILGTEQLGRDQIILEVGINVDENGKLCGDVDFEQVEPLAKMITPVPGGVGSVTTAVLMKHVLEAARKRR